METQEGQSIPILKTIRHYHLVLPLGLLSAEIAVFLGKNTDLKTYIFTLGWKKIVADERDEEKMRMFLSPGFNHKGEPITKEQYNEFLEALSKR